MTDLDWAVEGAPIGTWTTSNGTFDGVMQDTLTMAADGTGWLLTRSMLHGEELLPLMWKQSRPGVLELALLLPEEDPSEAPLYETVRYAVTTVVHDIGSDRVVLKNTDDAVFWNLAGPLVLTSRRPQAPRPSSQKA